MQTVYIGNTLINDVYLGSQRMDDTLNVNPAFRIEYVVIAGGGSGAKGDSTYTGWGGGGAGGFASGSLILNPISSYPIYVGAGGASQGGSGRTQGLNGTQTTAFSLTMIGGGGGGRPGISVANSGNSGGSGGGGGYNGGSGGSGTSLQGNSGGNAGSNTGGGGGGAAAAGGNGSATANGGNGLQSAISGTPTYYAAGARGNGANGGSNGLGYGNYGSGGEGSIQPASTAAGQDGVVIIRYLGPQKANGGTITTDGNFIIHTFNVGSGSLVTY